MNILYIAPRDPRVAITGSTTRSAFLWKALKRLGEVYTVIPPGEDVDLSDEYARNQLEADRIHVVDFKRLTGWSWPFFYLTRKLMKVGAFSFVSAHGLRRAIGWPDVHFDCVVARYIDMASFYSAWKIAPLYIDVDDMPLTDFDKISRYRLPAVLRPLSRSLVRLWQWTTLSKAYGLWAVSDDDMAALREHARTALLRNLAKESRPGYQLLGRQRRQLLTVGYFGFGPNVQGVDWFLRAVWPDVNRAYPDLEYVIAGGGLSQTMRTKWENVAGVRVLGFVDDLDAVYEESVAVVAPILAGAGTCVKAIEASVRGRKLIGTNCAVRGLNVADKVDLCISEFVGASDFLVALGEWLSFSDQRRHSVQEKIVATATRLNSFEAFQRSVKDMITCEES